MGGGQSGDDEVREPEAETVVEADTLVEPAVTATAEDLDSWPASIRERLIGLLNKGESSKSTVFAGSLSYGQGKGS